MLKELVMKIPFFYKNLYKILQNIAKFGLKICENTQFLVILSNKVYRLISFGNSTIGAHNDK